MKREKSNNVIAYIYYVFFCCHFVAVSAIFASESYLKLRSYLFM